MEDTECAQIGTVMHVYFTEPFFIGADWSRLNWYRRLCAVNADISSSLFQFSNTFLVRTAFLF